MSSEILWVGAGVLFTLAAATAVIYLRFPTKELKDRMKTWWIIVALFLTAVIVGKGLAVLLFALVSYLALKEYFSLIPSRVVDRRIMFYAYVSIPVQYYFAYIEWYGMFLVFIPVYLFLFLPFRQVLLGETKGFLENTARVHWGVMMFVFSISHLAYLANLKSEASPSVNGKALLLYLVLLTELNDIFQYIWGKSFGKRKIVPKVSPNKTVEGFLGAFVTIELLSAAFSFLTPFSIYEALAAGAIISVSGFVGDVVVSMIKRDVGVKDASNLLPGHGGILDRIDSLTYTVPLFFHYVHYLYF